MLDQRDWKFVPVDPDPNFSEERNKQVIAETIETNERLRKRRQREFGSRIREKSEAVAQYLDDVVKGKTSSSVEKYFGKKELTRLRGEEIINKLKGRLSDVKIKEAVSKAKKISSSKLA